jgi:peptide/nickel transport system substrate-binding protein
MNIEGLQWFPDYPTVAAFYDPLLACRTWIRDSTSNLNGSQYCNHHVDTLVAKAQALRFNKPAQSASLWRQVYDDIVRDAPVIPTTVFGGHTMVSSRVGNYQSNPLWGVNLDQIWVK